jgi:hypothetical protein
VIDGLRFKQVHDFSGVLNDFFSRMFRRSEIFRPLLRVSVCGDKYKKASTMLNASNPSNAIRIVMVKRAFPLKKMMACRNLSVTSFLIILISVNVFSKEIRIHREHPKSINPNGPCSTILEVDESTTIDGVLSQASKRLEFPAIELRLDGRVLNDKDLVSLPDKTVIGVFESKSDHQSESLV